ncbi:MAG: hypothetical protein JXN61_14765 [Sedimentisphaerales bacterium]|nr:hypothetical protein [Sedimentisphaerales bacterium]
MHAKRTQRTILPSLLIGLGWVLLAWNVIALITGTANLGRANLAQKAAATLSAHLIHSMMLAAAAIALSLVAYLHFKQGYSRTTIIAASITIVLAFTLFFPAHLPASTGRYGADASSVDTPETEIYADGLVTGILFSDDRPAAVIGSQVLYEGDVKEGVTVVKITKEKVQFEKNGRLWTQKVQEIPPSYWK